MRLKEFIALNKLEQSRLVGGAKWIGSKRQGTTVTVLYLIDEFHVEAVYRRKNMQLLELNGVTDDRILDSYSRNNTINPITLSSYRDIKAGTFDQRFTFNF